MWSFVQKDKNTPEDVAKSYLTHIRKMEFDKAKELVTEESKGTIDFLAAMAKMVGEEAEKTAKQKFEIVNVKCEVQNNKAVCGCIVLSEGKTESDTLNLVKVNEKWLVVQEKEQPSE